MHDGHAYAVSVGFDPSDGRVGEVFTHGAKVGSAMDGILDDACIALSLLLQHGIAPMALAREHGASRRRHVASLDHRRARRRTGSGGTAMRRLPKGYGGERTSPDEVKREGWHEQGILVASADDPRLAQPSRRPDPPVLRDEGEPHIDSFAK